MTDQHALTSGTADYRRLLVALLFAGIGTFSQLYSVQAVLTLIQADLGLTPAESSLTVSAGTLGITLAVIPWSVASDRIGRRRAMVLALCLAAVFAFAGALAPTYPLVVAARLAEGCALGGIPAVAMAYIAEEVDPRHTALAAASFISGNSLGGLSGRLLAAPVAELTSWRGGVLAVACWAVIATIGFILLAPRQRGFRPRPARLSALGGRLLASLSDRRLLVLYLQPFLLMGAFVAMYNYIGFHLERPPFLLSPGWVSLLFCAYLFGAWSSREAGKLSVRHGRRRVMLASTGCMILAAGIALIPWLPAVIVGLVLFTAGFFGAHSVANGWVPAIASEAPAQASSFYILCYYAGSSLFGYVAGLVFAALGWAALMGFLALLLVVAMVSALVALPR